MPNAEWDVYRYSETLMKTDGLETELKKYQPLYEQHTVEVEACTVVDRHDNIIAWYLPNILNAVRTVRLLLFHMAAELTCSRKICGRVYSQLRMSSILPLTPVGKRF